MSFVTDDTPDDQLPNTSLVMLSIMGLVGRAVGVLSADLSPVPSTASPIRRDH